MTKELANIILGEDYDNLQQYNTDQIMNDSNTMSANDFAAKCKKWALTQNCSMQLPSKELLSLIFNKKVTWLMDIKEDVDTHNTIKIVFQFDNIYYGGISGIEDEQINVYELAHKCKEWARDKGFILTTNIGDDKHEAICVFHPGDGCLTADTEIEAIFSACEWIMNDEAKKNEMK